MEFSVYSELFREISCCCQTHYFSSLSTIVTSANQLHLESKTLQWFSDGFFFFFLWQTVILESIRVGLDQLYVTSKKVHGNFWVMCTVWKMFWNMHTTVTRNCLTLLFLNSLKCLQPCSFLPCKLQHYISDVCCFAFFHSSDWGFSLWDALTYRAAVFPAVHVPLALISEKSQS